MVTFQISAYGDILLVKIQLQISSKMLFLISTIEFLISIDIKN